MKYLLLSITILFLSAFNTPEPPVTESVVKKDLPYLLKFYKARHQSPELSLEEKETSKALAEELRKVGFEVTENFGGYGVVGIFKNGDGPTILYRTDMDALPMFEKTELPYASEVKTAYNGSDIGTMHSCGHDMHMATWVGVGRAMVKMKKQWKGTLMMIGQPAEEIGAGAKLMLDKGLYKTFGVPNYGIGLHCSPVIPAGQVGMGKGYTMANAESVDIKVFGVGAHGASPHMSIDPVVLASMMVMEFQTIVSRSVKPTETAVVTVGAIEGGAKHNIIPDEVTLKLTVRTYKEEIRQLVRKRIAEIAKGTAIAAGVPEDKMPIVEYSENWTPSNYNHPELVDKMIASTKKVIGQENILNSEPLMVAEDFSRYGRTEEKVPTVLFWLGTVPDERMEKGYTPGLHSPFYYPAPEKSLETGVSVVTQSMLDLFGK